jgi:Papain family cysteine protease
MALFASNDPARIKIDKTKLSLAAQKPVIVAMHLRNNFIGLGRDNRYWLPMLGDTTELYYHAMTVVGFDDGKGAFQVMNSWGEGWGNDGFFWIRYDDYARQTKYAYELTVQSAKKKTLIAKTGPKPVAEATQTLFGSLNVRYPSGSKDGVFQFKNAAFAYKNGVYELAGPENTWPVGKLYQLLAGNVMAGSYLYAFSFDADREIRVHWPRDSRLDEKFEGLNESAVVTSTRISIVIPGEKTALKLEKTGDEYLCLLFSKDPLRDFNAVLQQIKGYENGVPLPERVGKALGKRLIPEKALRCTLNAPEFSTTAETGSAAALFLKIPVR